MGGGKKRGTEEASGTPYIEDRKGRAITVVMMSRAIENMTVTPFSDSRRGERERGEGKKN